MWEEASTLSVHFPPFPATLFLGGKHVCRPKLNHASSIQLAATTSGAGQCFCKECRQTAKLIFKADDKQ
jgi:hypothetical protein